MSPPNRPSRSRPPRRPGAPRRRDETPELLTSIRSALRSDHPLQLLLLAAALVEVADNRNQNPFLPNRSDGPGISEIIDSFVNVDLPETTALLTAMDLLLEGKPGSGSIRRELRRRTHRLPAWLTSLKPMRVTRVTTTTHPFHDGEDVFVEVLTDGGHSLTVAVYVDHNLGTLIKDAFIIPDDIDAVRAILLAHTDDPDVVMTPLDPAEARARIEAAADAARRTFPPFESDTWPLCRPLVELVTRLLPHGGEGYRFTEWSDAARGDLEQRFLASAYAANLDADQRDLVDPLLWFGCDYGIGEPLNWSPTRAEIFLLDWVPRKLLAGPRVLRKIPALLRAFIAFGHEQIGIRDSLTAETLRAIDHFGPAYRAAVASPRSTGPLGLLEQAGIISIEGTEPPEWDPLGQLDRQVGGREALEALHDRPLPDDPFRWEGVPEDVQPLVAEVLERCDAFCDRWLDVEHRTAVRRLLAMVAAADPGVFSGRADTAAAALCWIIGKVNGVFDQRWGGHGSMRVKDLMAWFDLTGSPSNRAARMLRAVGVEDRWFAIWNALGDPALLVSRQRTSILKRREQIEQKRPKRDVPAANRTFAP